MTSAPTEPVEDARAHTLNDADGALETVIHTLFCKGTYTGTREPIMPPVTPDGEIRTAAETLENLTYCTWEDLQYLKQHCNDTTTLKALLNRHWNQELRETFQTTATDLDHLPLDGSVPLISPATAPNHHADSDFKSLSLDAQADCIRLLFSLPREQIKHAIAHHQQDQLLSHIAASATHADKWRTKIRDEQATINLKSAGILD